MLKLYDQMTWAKERLERSWVRTEFEYKKLGKAAGNEREKIREGGASAKLVEEDRASRGRHSHFSFV